MRITLLAVVVLFTGCHYSVGAQRVEKGDEVCEYSKRVFGPCGCVRHAAWTDGRIAFMKCLIREEDEAIKQNKQDEKDFEGQENVTPSSWYPEG